MLRIKYHELPLLSDGSHELWLCGISDGRVQAQRGMTAKFPVSPFWDITQLVLQSPKHTQTHPEAQHALSNASQSRWNKFVGYNHLHPASLSSPTSANISFTSCRCTPSSFVLKDIEKHLS